MTERTFGWVQDSGRLSKLRHVVEVFSSSTDFHAKLCKRLQTIVTSDAVRMKLLNAMHADPLLLSYRDLVGKSSTPRADSQCNGILQAAIKGQKRPFLSDWAADNYLRWAHALGLVVHHVNGDCFGITECGQLLVDTRVGSDAEDRIFCEILLSYPPVSRILELLIDAKDHIPLTKFELGRELGFVGEKGFTSISLEFFLKEFALAGPEARKAMLQNWEGDSDKYARMICSWLMQVKSPWVRKVRREFSLENYGDSGNVDLQAYSITGPGFTIRKRLSGISSASRVPKLVHYQMLGTKVHNRENVRYRRAFVLMAITSKGRSVEEIAGMLKAQSKGVPDSVIISDIEGLRRIGLNISHIGKVYRCRDIIRGLKLPAQQLQNNKKLDVVSHQTEDCRSRLSSELQNYVMLIDYAFGGHSKSKLFEIKTAELLGEVCGFKSIHLGGPNEPDIIFHNDGDTGIIVDTKAYKGGFSLRATERDKMVRYMHVAKVKSEIGGSQWWAHLPSSVNRLIFLFIAGRFADNIGEQLNHIKELTDNSPGNALTTYKLLLLADAIYKGEMDKDRFLIDMLLQE